MEIRVGLGHDTHRLEPGGPLRLGGVDIEFDARLVGHSDADVLLHAVTDSLLGAAGLGDIGEHFPNTDPAHHGRDSAEMLASANALIRQAGWRINNLDCVVLAERPKLLPYRELICENIAGILSLLPDQVSLKGKTGEKSGDVGNGRIMQSMCVALLQRG